MGSAVSQPCGTTRSCDRRGASSSFPSTQTVPLSDNLSGSQIDADGCWWRPCWSSPKSHCASLLTPQECCARYPDTGGQSRTRPLGLLQGVKWIQYALCSKLWTTRNLSGISSQPFSLWFTAVQLGTECSYSIRSLLISCVVVMVCSY